MKFLRFLKKYGAIIGTFLLGLFLAIFTMGKINKFKDKRKIKKDIKKIDKEIDKVEDEIKVVEEAKDKIKDDIKNTDEEIKDLKEDLKNVGKEERKTDIDDATDFLNDFANRNKD